MDQVKRAASRLRRLQSVLAPWNGRQEFFEQPFFVRPLGTGEGALGLRQTIDDNVVAFIPPSLPITTPDLTCTNALVEFRRSGHWTINASLEAHGQNPVAFMLGFMTNQHGYFGGLIGALNYPGELLGVISPTSSATVTTHGGSDWIATNHETAFSEGVTIRVHSTTSLNNDLHLFAGEWARTFDRARYRPLSILDTEDHWTAWGAMSLQDGSLLDEVQAGTEDPGLSFDVSLRFE